MEGDSALFPRSGDGAAPTVAVADLAQALLLMRANTMKILRLQLAMERGDRTVALQAMDDLIDLDGRIAEFLGRMPVHDDLAAMARDIDDQRTAVLREKFGLAAGMVRRGSEMEQDGTDQGVVEDEPYRPAYYDLEESRGGRGRLVLIVLLALLVVAAVAGGVALYMGVVPQSVLDQLPQPVLQQIDRLKAL